MEKTENRISVRLFEPERLRMLQIIATKQDGFGSRKYVNISHFIRSAILRHIFLEEQQIGTIKEGCKHDCHKL